MHAEIPVMKLSRFTIFFLTLLLGLAACGGGGGSNNGGSATPAPPVATQPPPTPALSISVLAGQPGGAGNTDGTSGRLMQPRALSFDLAGNLYVGDASISDFTVRKLQFSNRGDAYIETYSKGLDWWVQALAADASGNLIAIIRNRIVRIAPDGTRTTLAGGDEADMVDGLGDKARFSSPQALAIDSAGLIWVADGAAIRTITAGGEVRTHLAATAALTDPIIGRNGQPATYPTHPTGLAFDSAGNLVIAVGEANARKVTPAGVRLDTEIPAGSAIAADREGRLYAFTKCALYKADTTGQISLLAGAPYQYGAVDGAGPEARFGALYSCDGQIATDGAGNVVVTDLGNSIVRKVMPSGAVITVAGLPAHVGMLDGTGSAALFDFGALDMTFDGKDSIYMTVVKVRKITRAGVVTTLDLPEKDANQNPINYYSGAMAYQGSLIGVASGVVYLVEENGAMRTLTTLPKQIDGTNGKADLAGVRGVTRDGAGNIYLLTPYIHFATSSGESDWGETHIRKITPAGAITTVYTQPYKDYEHDLARIVADKDGKVYASTNSGAVLRVAADGSTSSIPVDLRTNPWLAVDGSGNLYVANHSGRPAIVEKISPSGQVQIVAGKRDQVGLITGPAPGSLNQIYGMTADDQGAVYVLTENAIVRIGQ
jgi:glucose/arabinose dehydrogenase